MNRREMLELSLLSGGALLLSGNSNRAVAVSFPTGGNFPPSPKTTPFMQELPRMPLKSPLPRVDDYSVSRRTVVSHRMVRSTLRSLGMMRFTTTYRDSLERDCCPTTSATPARMSSFPPKRFYVLNVRQAFHDFHPEMTALTDSELGSIIWGYDGIYPGPTFMSKYGTPIFIRIINGLFDDPDANGRLCQVGQRLVVSGIREFPLTCIMAIRGQKATEILQTFIHRSTPVPMITQNIPRRFWQ